MPARYRRLHYLLIAIAALLVATAVGWFLARHTLDHPIAVSASPEPKALTAVKSEVHLYFGDLQGRFLRAEQRVLDRSADDVVFGRQLIDALIQGPQEPGGRTIPEKASLRGFFITSGTAYVDFAAEAFAEHPGGVEMELLCIYSIVNTLVVNLEAIRDVQLLIGGQEQSTLAGHIDIEQRFMADMMWIR